LKPLSALVLILIFTCYGAFADPPENYPFVSFNEGMQTAKAQHKMVFIYFGRYGCAWCDQVNKRVFVDPELKSLYSNNYVLIYVDAESGKRLRLPSGERITEAELGVRYQVFGTPMFVYLEPDGKIIAKLSGVQTLENFREYDRYVIEGHYKTRSTAEYFKGKN
jgi:thioredoxin-related protein